MTSTGYVVIQISNCWNRCLRRSLNCLKNFRARAWSRTSTKIRTSSSRYSCPRCDHVPWIVWLSTEIAPNWARSSKSVAPINSSGIGCPSLNASGSRISYRQYDLLIGRLARHCKPNPAGGQDAEHLLRHQRRPVIERFERAPSGEKPKRRRLGGRIWKLDRDHTTDYIIQAQFRHARLRRTVPPSARKSPPPLARSASEETPPAVRFPVRDGLGR